MKRIRLKHLSPLIGVVLFGLAIYVLNRALGEHSYREILRQLSEFSPARIAGAIGLTALTYSILTLYDHLALNYLGQPLGKVRVSIASFISYSFSRNIGLSILTAGSIRYRYYSSWGLTAEKVARLVTFAVLGFTLGMLTMGGSITLFSPAPLPEIPWLPVWVLRPAGGLAVAAAFSYLLLIFLWKKPVRIRGRHFPLPSPRHAFGQMIIGSLDWTLTAGVLYFLLAGHAPLSLFQFLQIYLIAQIAVILSHVPAGLGVFESVILLLVPGIDAPELLGILIAYRAVFFLLPFGTAILLMGVMEAIQHRRRFRRAREFLGSRLSSLAPPVLAGAVVIAGSIVLFTAATPAIPGRLSRIEFLPLPVIELSHFLAALTGAALLLSARGLQLRLVRAYKLTMLLLCGGIIFSLLKGLFYEQAAALAVVAIALAPSRDLFFRKTPLLEEPYTPGWITIILIVLGASAWLLFFSYKEIAYNPELWWRFGYGADAPRSLRAGLGAAALLAGFFIAKRFYPYSPEPGPPGPRELARAESIVERQPSIHGCMALLGDKHLLFHGSGVAFLMFRGGEESRVVLGDPVGATEHWRELAWNFRELCERRDSWPVFFGIGQESCEFYLDMGMALEQIGDTAGVPLSGLPADSRLENQAGTEAYRFEIASPDEVPEKIPHLRQISEAWQKTAEIQNPVFSRTGFHPDFMSRFPLALVYEDEKIVAYASLLTTPGKEEIAADLVQFLPGAPNEILRFILVRSMEWAKEEGFRTFDLGLTPCFEEECDLSPSLWTKYPEIFRYGEYIRDPVELRSLKDEFRPVWSRTYLAFPGGAPLSKILAEISQLFMPKR